MRRRLLIAATLAAGLALAPSSHAVEAPKSAQVTDPASDANFINDNAPVSSPLIPPNPANNNPTPVGSEPTADILAIEWKTLKAAGATKGFTVTMYLTAAPTKSGILFRATSSTADCSTLWFQWYTSDPGNTPQGSLRHTCDGTQVVPIPVKVVENTITWTYEFSNKDLPNAQVRTGVDIAELGGHARPFITNPTCVDVTRCTTNPLQYDTTNNFAGPYKVGS